MASKTTQGQSKQEQEREFALPAGYEHESSGFARAFAHAKKIGNTDKASLLYAQSHADDFFEEGDE